MTFWLALEGGKEEKTERIDFARPTFLIHPNWSEMRRKPSKNKCKFWSPLLMIYKISILSITFHNNSLFYWGY